MNLWSLQFLTHQLALPVLVRAGVAVNNDFDPQSINPFVNSAYSIYDASTRPGDPIDVLNNFSWTKSPKSSRIDAPSIFLTEKRLAINSIVSNVANSVFASTDSVSTGFGVVGNILQQAGLPQNGPVQATTNIVSNTLKQVAQSLQSNISLLTNANVSHGNNVLTPYDSLYLTEKTGFNYSFPYFSDNFVASGLTFGESSESENLFSGIANLSKTVSDTLASATGATSPGTYIERSQIFKMDGKGRSYDIKFPLLNTESFEDIIANWQLLFALVYQNRPGRITRSIIDLPVIYEMTIPGITFIPYAYIESLDVQFLGNRRMMTVPIPTINQGQNRTTSVNTIVPDAYQVSITLRGLNDDTRNFMYSGVVRQPVTVNGS